MARRKSIKRGIKKEVKETPDHLAWLGYVNSGTLKNLALVAAAVAAIFYLNANIFQPVYESGPLPIPSRAEVEALRKEAAAGLADVNMGLAETLEVAKAARIEAQQAVQQSADSRLSRLTQQKLQLEATIRSMPNDPVFNDLLARTIQEIARLTAPSPAPSLPTAAVPTTK